MSDSEFDVVVIGGGSTGTAFEKSFFVTEVAGIRTAA